MSAKVDTLRVPRRTHPLLLWLSHVMSRSLTARTSVVRFLGIGCIGLGCFSIGCSKSDPVASNPSQQQQPTSAVATADSPQATTVDPAVIVSQFLDLVRRGGENSQANALLTAKAQQELAKIGRSIQPIGSPDASYKVTRSTDVPEEENAMVVHTVWTEPDGAGGTADYEVVWAVQLENGQWRISGLAMASENTEATVINFEDGAMMAQILGDGSDPAQSADPSDSPSHSQAQAPGDATIRR